LISGGEAVREFTAIVAAFWVFAIFVLMRAITGRRGDAVLFSALAMSSAAGMFWFVLAETFPLGSVSLLAPLVVLSIAERSRVGVGWYVAASAFSLSISTTNWMSGIAAAFARFARSTALTITVTAFGAVLLLAQMQGGNPSAKNAFLQPWGSFEWFMTEQAGGVQRISAVLLFHTMVMPAILEHGVSDMGQPLMTVQAANPGSASSWGLAAVVIWVCLLGVGLWTFVRHKGRRPLRTALGLTLVGQVVLHLFFGDETFLYSLHVLPLMVALAAWGCCGAARPLVIVFAGLLLMTGGVNNILQFRDAARRIDVFDARRSDVLREMKRRSGDPWPRGSGHVALAEPDSAGEGVAYHEPGGSFSPRVGSFGVSIWIVDWKGELLHTSDDLSVRAMDQEVVWSPEDGGPSVRTRAFPYDAQWSWLGKGRWRFDLDATRAPGEAVIVFRSVGPSGGPIHSLTWANGRLSINDRWSVTVNPSPEAVYLGEEGSWAWSSEKPARSGWRDQLGWGYARVYIGTTGKTSIVIEDSV
jgi:hypothetical protein